MSRRRRVLGLCEHQWIDVLEFKEVEFPGGPACGHLMTQRCSKCGAFRVAAIARAEAA